MLYIVATPIGNLKDITLRALEVLKNADFILCEDTRVSGNLLRHFEISKPLYSLNAQNESGKAEIIIDRLQAGETGALITDNGTPGISDPGVRLVNAVHLAGIKVIPIPGASAVTAALSVSGLPTDAFVFEGFLPQKKGRQKQLQKLAVEERTIVLYESPFRVMKLLEELCQYMPERQITVCRELTKHFEEVLRGSPEHLLKHFNEHPPKGEFVIIIASIGFVQRSE